jgi:hypothetical protein
MNIIPVFNKNSPQAHMELELDVLGVHRKLVKYVVHLSKRKNWKKIIFLYTSCRNSNRLVFGLKEFYGLTRLYSPSISIIVKELFSQQNAC